MEMTYIDTLIAVADDCPVAASVVPAQRPNKTVAIIQYEMLVDAPFVYTQEDVLFNSWFERQGMSALTEVEIAQLRTEFFSKPQACLRASPLPKTHGWGLVFDHHGKMALCPMESAEYQELLTGGRVRVVKAMRSKRG